MSRWHDTKKIEEMNIGEVGWCVVLGTGAPFAVDADGDNLYISKYYRVNKTKPNFFQEWRQVVRVTRTSENGISILLERKQRSELGEYPIGRNLGGSDNYFLVESVEWFSVNPLSALFL